MCAVCTSVHCPCEVIGPHKTGCRTKQARKRKQCKPCNTAWKSSSLVFTTEMFASGICTSFRAGNAASAGGLVLPSNILGGGGGGVGPSAANARGELSSDGCCASEPGSCSKALELYMGAECCWEVVRADTLDVNCCLICDCIEDPETSSSVNSAGFVSLWSGSPAFPAVDLCQVLLAPVSGPSRRMAYATGSHVHCIFHTHTFRCGE